MLYHGVVLTGQSVKINEMVVGIVCVLGSCLAFIPKWLVNICYCWGMNTVTTNLMLVFDTPTYSLSWFWYIYMVYLGFFLPLQMSFQFPFANCKNESSLIMPLSGYLLEAMTLYQSITF